MVNGGSKIQRAQPLLRKSRRGCVSGALPRWPRIGGSLAGAQGRKLFWSDTADAGQGVVFNGRVQSIDPVTRHINGTTPAPRTRDHPFGLSAASKKRWLAGNAWLDEILGWPAPHRRRRSRPDRADDDGEGRLPGIPAPSWRPREWSPHVARGWSLVRGALHRLTFAPRSPVGPAPGRCALFGSDGLCCA